MMDRPMDGIAREEAREAFDEVGEVKLIEGGNAGDAAGRPQSLQPRGDGLDKQTRVRLLREERAIAAKYMSDPRKMRIYTVITLSCFAMWLAFFPLTMLDIVPLWPCFVLSCVFAAGGYITSHEAMHDNIGRRGTKYRFWNELVGELSTIILIFPFSMARLMHMHHHYHCNHPEDDPDYTDTATGPLAAWYKTWLNRQPGADGSIHHYKRVLQRIGTPAAAKALRDTAYLQLFAMFTMFAMCWTGFAFEAALLWWLPRHIGLSYIRYWLSWAPHHPREGRDRYTNTRVFRTVFGHWLSMGMQYHVVHHLYPGIPNHATKPAYYELKPILQKRGVDCSPL
jgi:beta-carotene hydroxylase